MLGKLKRFVEDSIVKELQGESATSREHGLQLATAALFLEVMEQDDQANEAERAVIVRALQSKFGLGKNEIAELLDLAEAERKQATDYYQFTSLIHQQFSYEQKTSIIEHMWMIAFADGELDPYEEHLIRKVADLMYITHADFLSAKHRMELAR